MFNPTEYWDTRYKLGGNSGAGSYGEVLEKKLDLIKTHVKDVETITELGCGDFNFGSRLMEIFPNAIYSGLDISEVIVERNKKLYPQYNFEAYRGYIPTADLILCVDVLFHIIDDNDYFDTLINLKMAWKKYLILTAYEREEKTGEHVKLRVFDPSFFGEPIAKGEVEEGGMYMYIFKK